MSEQDTNGQTEVRMVAVADCIPTPDNPRTIDRKAAPFLDLVASVKGAGVQVPVAVRPHPKREGKLDLRYGERRLLAAKAANVATIPALFYPDLCDQAAFDLTFAENFLREDLTILEEGKAVKTLMDRSDGDVKAVAARLGRTEKWVRLHAQLEHLDPKWLEVIAAPDEGLPLWGIGHLVLVARLPKDAQLHLLEGLRWGARHWTVSDLDQHINDEFLRVVMHAPWDVTDETLVPRVGACMKCGRRSSGRPGLFDDDVAPAHRMDKCLDAPCWKAKAAAHLARRRAELEKDHPGLVYVSTHPETWRYREGLKAEYGSLLEPHDFRRAKKDSPGAKPALVVYGKGQGTVVHVVKRSPGSRSGSTKKSGPVPLAERRAALTARRRALVIDQVKEKLHKGAPLAIADTAIYQRTVLALASVFGAKREYGGEDWKRFDKLVKKATDGAGALWLQLTPPLAGELVYFQKANIGTHLWKDCERIAGLLGLDVKAMLAEAAAAIPEPKSWANLKADGTPKGKAAKKTGRTKSNHRSKAKATRRTGGKKRKAVTT